ncbi:uncharacterized protein C8orf76 homolog [Denticeps clupeoides]|uniref:Uncharacterized protein n=1 Tax=Denticeps clupeoides TaxID=299321 RepID=A0AAY4CHT2_9TELE|nr:uncharacterized protein C8orf76 homolog [Denticeps clupeoides]
MEIFGSTFDDSVFVAARDRLSASIPSYRAKLCEPRWFCKDTDTEDTTERQKTLKFRADLAFRRRQYESALRDYTACLSFIPDGNLSVRRDVLEGAARCCCHLGRREQALDTTEKLRAEASNTCHLTCVLQLELSIHQRFGDLRGQISALQRLCSLHPFNPWYWFKLASGSQSLLESSPQAGREAEVGGDEQRKENGELWLKACVGFVRSRLLFGILRIQQSSFVLLSSEKAMQDSDQALRNLKPTERSLEIISEVMAEDLIPEKMREDNQDGESLAGLSIKNFEERWWDKLTSAGLMEKEPGTFKMSQGTDSV